MINLKFWQKFYRKALKFFICAKLELSRLEIYVGLIRYFNLWICFQIFGHLTQVLFYVFSTESLMQNLGIFLGQNLTVLLRKISEVFLGGVIYGCNFFFCFNGFLVISQNTISSQYVSSNKFLDCCKQQLLQIGRAHV
eukprot:TRINITY_DN29308_c0_g2_i1.p2 TRINITY_DN29308_c0_g2~~TRINITY_DN29308_c0_g2_i1.p2  ORF type:complete len:138 (-),score=8.25 TRINITY_DN29308_c0_g2_i1:33-446(-)